MAAQASRTFREHEPCVVEAVQIVAPRGVWYLCRTHTYYGNGVEPNEAARADYSTLPIPWLDHCDFQTRYPVGYEPRCRCCALNKIEHPDAGDGLCDDCVGDGCGDRRP